MKWGWWLRALLLTPSVIMPKLFFLIVTHSLTTHPHSSQTGPTTFKNLLTEKELTLLDSHCISSKYLPILQIKIFIELLSPLWNLHIIDYCWWHWLHRVEDRSDLSDSTRSMMLVTTRLSRLGKWPKESRCGISTCTTTSHELKYDIHVPSGRHREW